MATKRITFRLYPNKEQNDKLHYWRRDCLSTRETGNGAVGIDFGTHHALALDDGTVIDNPKFLKQNQQKISQAAKKARRKRNPQKGVKASRRWKKAAKEVGKIQSLVARQRQNWHHQVDPLIVSCNSLVATEKLNLKGMTKKAKKGSKRKKQKTGLNRSILDVGIGNLKSLIKSKVTEAGGFYVEVPTQKVKPSQTCPNCGHQKKKTLAERVHNCEKCSYSCDRDVASAKVCLNYARGMERASLDAESPSSTLCGSMKQLGTMKRQKRLSQR